MTTDIATAPVRKSVVVHASAAEAFGVFTGEIDTWWPRSHHVGRSPMLEVAVEGQAGGRCYTRHEDGEVVEWGRVLVWEPARRLVIAWEITPEWGHQPDLTLASEVEVRFVSLAAEATRVEVEHRLFERHGAGAEAMRSAVDAPNGWTKILELFSGRVAARKSRQDSMTTRQTIDRYFAGLEQRHGWETVLADDLAFTSFTSPVRELRGRDAFLAGTKRFYDSIRSFDVRDVLVEGERAVALTRYQVQPAGGRPAFPSDVAEVFTVRNGRIASFAIYFDSAPYPT